MPLGRWPCRRTPRAPPPTAVEFAMPLYVLDQTLASMRRRSSCCRARCSLRTCSWPSRGWRRSCRTARPSSAGTGCRAPGQLRRLPADRRLLVQSVPPSRTRCAGRAALCGRHRHRVHEARRCGLRAASTREFTYIRCHRRCLRARLDAIDRTDARMHHWIIESGFMSFVPTGTRRLARWQSSSLRCPRAGGHAAGYPTATAACACPPRLARVPAARGAQHLHQRRLRLVAARPPRRGRLRRQRLRVLLCPAATSRRAGTHDGRLLRARPPARLPAGRPTGTTATAPSACASTRASHSSRPASRRQVAQQQCTAANACVRRPRAALDHLQPVHAARTRASSPPLARPGLLEGRRNSKERGGHCAARHHLRMPHDNTTRRYRLTSGMMVRQRVVVHRWNLLLSSSSALLSCCCWSLREPVTEPTTRAAPEEQKRDPKLVDSSGADRQKITQGDRSAKANGNPVHPATKL